MSHLQTRALHSHSGAFPPPLGACGRNNSFYVWWNRELHFCFLLAKLPLLHTLSTLCSHNHGPLEAASLPFSLASPWGLHAKPPSEDHRLAKWEQLKATTSFRGHTHPPENIPRSVFFHRLARLCVCLLQPCFELLRSVGAEEREGLQTERHRHCRNARAMDCVTYVRSRRLTRC